MLLCSITFTLLILYQILNLIFYMVKRTEVIVFVIIFTLYLYFFNFRTDLVITLPFYCYDVAFLSILFLKNVKSVKVLVTICILRLARLWRNFNLINS